MLELYDKDFKADITKMFQQVWNNWKKKIENLSNEVRRLQKEEKN